MDFQELSGQHGGPAVYARGVYLYPNGARMIGGAIQPPSDDPYRRMDHQLQYHRELLNIVERDLRDPCLQWPSGTDSRLAIYGAAPANTYELRQRLQSLAAQQRTRIAELEKRLPRATPYYGI